MSRPGKIAKLPTNLQEELNRQLERGVPGRVLVEWLNNEPAVQEVLWEFFEGARVNEQNLCAWRRGGFADWRVRRQFFDDVREVAEGAGDFETVAANMADHAARLLAAHYAVELHNLIPASAACSSSSGNAKASGNEPCPYAALDARLKPLGAITRAMTALRRDDREATRLQMEQVTFAFASKAHVASATASSAADNHQKASAEGSDRGKSSQIKIPDSPANAATPSALAAEIHHQTTPAGGPDPGKSSQIKVPEFPANTIATSATSASATGDTPQSLPAERASQTQSNQIKVPKIPQKPVRPPHPAGLQLTFPPPTRHLFAAPPTPERVA